MKVCRQITDVLCGLLDTYSSRYSDYDGYWLLGLLVREADLFSLDLLHENSVSVASPVVAKAQRLAQSKFQELLRHSHIPIECVSEAKLIIQKSGDSKVGPVNGHMSRGHQMILTGEAVSDLGKKYRAQKVVFVAPHDPSLELRSTRREEPS